MNSSQLRLAVEDRYPIQRGQRFSIRIEFDRALADGTEMALQFEAVDGSDGFEIGDHQRIGLRVPEYRVHGRASGEAGVYSLSRITLTHPALTSRVFTAVPDVGITIVDDLPAFPELVAAERCLSNSDMARPNSEQAVKT